MNPLLRVCWCLAALALTGCVPNKVYRNVAPSVIEIPAIGKLPLASSPLDHPTPCPQGVNVASAPMLLPYDAMAAAHGASPGRPCMAVIEFDDFGEPWVKDALGRPTQVEAALALIRKAIQDDPKKQPVILTFVHGWKHNADPLDTNVQGFEETLNYLYTNFYGPKASEHYEGHVVVGIYIAWRGDSVSKYWNVLRQLSVYNRESAAMRVGSGASVSDVLMRISHLAHPPRSQNKTNQPLLIFVGHSFGALVLERAMVPAFIHLMDRQGTEPSEDTPETLADLVIYLNSAAAATEAKPLLDYMAAEGITYQVSGANGQAIDEPLFLSIASSADLPVGLLLPVEHYGSGILYSAGGSFRSSDPLSCYDLATGRHSVDPKPFSQKNFWLQAAGHMDAVESHELKERVSKSPGRLKQCPKPESGAYGMYPLTDPVTGFASRCYQIERKGFAERKAPPCNQTPYWILPTDATLMPDHGTIFTGRLIGLIGQFLPAPGLTGVIATPSLTTQKSRAAAANAP